MKTKSSIAEKPYFAKPSAERSAIMRAIRSKDTKPELAVRSLLHRMSGIKMARFNDGLKRTLCTDPHIGFVNDVSLLQLKRHAIKDVIAYVFLIGENLVHSAARPHAPKIGHDAALIKKCGNYTLIIITARADFSA